MPRNIDWRTYVDNNGDFELAAYLYKVISDLMKSSLDYGTLLSTDQTRLRAYKESVKGTFKGRWLEVAQALEAFDIIVPCGCPANEYCKVCGGSRYRLNSALSPDELREIALFEAPGSDPKMREKLEDGLMKALKETGRALS